jgi:hypothetical protein
VNQHLKLLAGWAPEGRAPGNHRKISFQIVAHDCAVVGGRAAVPGAGVGAHALVEPTRDGAAGRQVVDQVGGRAGRKVRLGNELLAVQTVEPVIRGKNKSMQS